ncbi:MAG: hypothetical protein VB021_01345 [Oscillospiraceae bacterium]|nr:hypothetical protein [Oscillospiraceae bacterium]
MNWMTIRRTAAYLKENNPNTMIGESTIRTLIDFGFPCVRIGNRVLINIDTFADDMNVFVARRNTRRVPIGR